MTDKEYTEMIIPYDDAREMLVRRLSALNHSLHEESCNDPIHGVRSRIKKKKSLEKKLIDKYLDPTVENAVKYLHDIGGVRVICYFVDDIYTLVDILKRQHDLTIIEEIDYIKNPKTNGYRSYHIILSIPVYYLDCTKEIIIEVQFRTLSMDFWASMEHRLVYKKNVSNKGKIEAEMCRYAESLTQLENRIHQLRVEIEDLTEPGELHAF